MCTKMVDRCRFDRKWSIDVDLIDTFWYNKYVYKVPSSWYKAIDAIRYDLNVYKTMNLMYRTSHVDRYRLLHLSMIIDDILPV